jgi:CDP-diacylglycerol--glycerol-3-phosphate 3-phosphatidyltransferase
MIMAYQLHGRNSDMTQKNLPNILTLARIILIPFFVIAFYLPWTYATILAAIIFVLAALTDWFDGYLARHWNVTSALGAFLDPVADKLLVSTALVLLVSSPLEYLTLPAVIIIGREIAISALREWMAKLGQTRGVAVNLLGKLKTIIQMVAIVMLIVMVNITNSLPWLGILIEPLIYLSYLFIYLAAILTLWSMTVYMMAAWREIKNPLTSS